MKLSATTEQCQSFFAGELLYIERRFTVVTVLHCKYTKTGGELVEHPEWTCSNDYQWVSSPMIDCSSRFTTRQTSIHVTCSMTTHSCNSNMSLCTSSVFCFQQLTSNATVLASLSRIYTYTNTQSLDSDSAAAAIFAELAIIRGNYGIHTFACG
eukprot:scpid107205/ scgid23548/ 